MAFMLATASLSAQDAGSDGFAPGPQRVVTAVSMSEEAKRLAEAHTQFAAGLLALREDGRFSRRVAGHLLAALANDPTAIDPLEMLLSGWSKNDRPDPKQIVRHLPPLAQANPQAWRLNLVAADALLQLDRNAEALALLAAALDQVRRHPAAALVGEADGLELIAMAANAYAALEQFEAGAQMFYDLLDEPLLAENFLVRRTAAEFFAGQADQGEDDGWWLFPSRRRRFQQALDENLTAAAAAWRQQTITVMAQGGKVPVMELAGLLRVCKRYQRFALGEELIAEALLNDPQDLRAIMFMAAFLADAGKYAEAARLWRRIVADRPADPDFHFELGRMALLAGWPEEAARELNACLLLKPEDQATRDQARFQAALAYLELGRNDKAIYVLGKLKDLPDAHYLVAMAHLRESRPAEAMTALAQAEKLALAAEPRDAAFLSLDFYLTFALCCDQAKDYPREMAILERLRQDYPDQPEVANFFGYFLAERNQRLDEAETLVREALAQEPDSPAYLDSLAWVLYRQGRFAEAARQIELAIAGEEGQPDAVIADHAGDIYLALGDRDRALEFWRLAASLDHPDLDHAAVRAKMIRHEPAPPAEPLPEPIIPQE